MRAFGPIKKVIDRNLIDEISDSNGRSVRAFGPIRNLVDENLIVGPDGGLEHAFSPVEKIMDENFIDDNLMVRPDSGLERAVGPRNKFNDVVLEMRPDSGFE